MGRLPQQVGWWVSDTEQPWLWPTLIVVAVEVDGVKAAGRSSAAMASALRTSRDASIGVCLTSMVLNLSMCFRPF